MLGTQTDQFASQAPTSSDETMDVYNPDAHLTEDEAREKDPSLVLGDTHEEPVDSVPFGRIVAQTAKQVILQKVREASLTFCKITCFAVCATIRPNGTESTGSS